MGCCCLQATFQAADLSQACLLYDQLTPIAPIILALSASSPIWRGYLSDIDCRWNVLKQGTDDRTAEELLTINKSRWDSAELYISAEGAKYNDAEFNKEELIYETLLKAGMQTPLANHFANMFIRDPLIVYKENLENLDEQDTMAFQLFNSSNWRPLRIKPPPLKCNQPETNRIGWCIEFRPTELQMTNFENAAFASFVILLARTVAALKLNFLINISKVDTNMSRAQQRNACMSQKFYFRQNVSSNEIPVVSEMNIDQIINGSPTFRGLISYINEYLDGQNLSNETSSRIGSYLNLISCRANGRLLTPASWIRKFVASHPKYLKDSIINEEINYDLMWSVWQIQNDHLKCPDLLPF